MVALGILMILLAIAAAIAILVNEPATATTVTVFGRTFEVSTTQMFVLGVITTALFLIGLALLLGGLRRARARRKELRYARVESRDRLTRLEEENRELQRRLRESPDAPAGRHAAAEEPVRRGAPEPAAKERAGASRGAGYAEEGYPGDRGEHRGEYRGEHQVEHRGEYRGEPAAGTRAERGAETGGTARRTAPDEPAEQPVQHRGFIDRLVSIGRHHR